MIPWCKSFVGALVLFMTPSCLLGNLVQTVNVDIEAENAVRAKEKALSQAEREAARMLLEVVAPAAVGLGAMEDLGSKCSAGFEIADEKFSSARYLARIHQQLNKKCVIGELRKVGLTATFPKEEPARAKSSPLLLVGLQADPHNGAISLWEESHPLPPAVYQAFAKSKKPFGLPLHDLNDQVLLPSAHLENLSFSAFEKIAKYYHAESVYLLVAHQGPATSHIQAYKITPFKTLACKAHPIEFSAHMTPESYTQALAQQGVLALEHCAPGHHAPSPHLGAGPKEPLAPSQAQESRILLMKFQDMNRYLHLKKALSSLPSLHSIRTQELSATSAFLHVDLSTTLDLFKHEGEEIGLKVIENSDQTIEVSALR